MTDITTIELGLDYHAARKAAIAAFEAAYVRQLLAAHPTASAAAKAANMDRCYLHRLMRNHDVKMSKPSNRR